MSVDPKSNYYDAGNLEVQEIIKAKLTPEQYKGWLLGNIIKYSGRANWKGTFERDVEKITVYSGLLREFNAAKSEIEDMVDGGIVPIGEMLGGLSVEEFTARETNAHINKHNRSGQYPAEYGCEYKGMIFDSESPHHNDIGDGC